MRKIRIGTIGLSYNHRKNFFGLIADRVAYFKVLDWISPYRVMMRSGGLKRLLAHPVMKNIHFAPFQRKVDIFHFFNALSLSYTPWITTFETSLPRWEMDKFGLDRISADSCKCIVAMSACAKHIMLTKVKQNFPEYLEVISNKLLVIHPSQNTHIESWNEKGLSFEGKLVFTLVGNDFFRKGGAETLRVFEKLINEGADLELRIVSNLKYGDYASQATLKDQEFAIALIEKYSEHIKHFQNIPNAEVMKLLKSTHVGLLPTYADTYGYSVLEYQSMGCPVVSTDIRALPEINSNERGWIIEVPKDEYGEGLYRKKEKREELSQILERGLENALREILDKPSIISEKGKEALEGLKEKNDPVKNGERYYTLYQRALGRN